MRHIVDTGRFVGFAAVLVAPSCAALYTVLLSQGYSHPVLLTSGFGGFACGLVAYAVYDPEFLKRRNEAELAA